jgi:hypothetical protein
MNLRLRALAVYQIVTALVAFCTLLQAASHSGIFDVVLLTAVSVIGALAGSILWTDERRGLRWTLLFQTLQCLSITLPVFSIGVVQGFFVGARIESFPKTHLAESTFTATLGATYSPSCAIGFGARPAPSPACALSINFLALALTLYAARRLYLAAKATQVSNVESGS